MGLLGCLNGKGGKKVRRSKNSNLHLAGIFGKRSDFSKNDRSKDDGPLRRVSAWGHSISIGISIISSAHMLICTASAHLLN